MSKVKISIASLVGTLKVKKSDLQNIQPVIMDALITSVGCVVEATKRDATVVIGKLINEVEIID